MTPLDRRAFLGLASTFTAAPAVLKASPSLAVTDVLGRTVALKEHPRRIVLLEARDILTMAVLHPAPASLVVGWAAVDRVDSSVVRKDYEATARGPIPVVGKQSPDTISLEGILSVDPDLVVATSYMEPGNGKGLLTQRLEQLGIPVVFSNSSSNQIAGENGARMSPMQELPALMRMWGAILDRGEQAGAFTAFYEATLARIEQRLRDATPRKTYLEIMSVYDDCCWSAGHRIWGELLSAAGGRPLDGVSTPWTARVQLEHLIAERPEVYIATGGDYASRSRPGLGPGLDPVAAREGLRRLTERTGFGMLPAVRNGHVHAIWTGLITIPPLNLLFIEIAAKWLHPERTDDADPRATLAAINQHFLALPLGEPCWISLDQSRP